MDKTPDDITLEDLLRYKYAIRDATLEALLAAADRCIALGSQGIAVGLVFAFEDHDGIKIGMVQNKAVGLDVTLEVLKTVIKNLIPPVVLNFPKTNTVQ